MNDERTTIAGKQGMLVGGLQEEYGIVSGESVHRRDDFTETLEELKRSNARLIELQIRLETGKLAGRKTRSSPVLRKKRKPARYP
jgi:hypothetical protein